VVAFAVGALVTELLWRLVPDELSISTRIVGYPIFADFDITRYIDAYYLVAFAMPASALGAWVLVSRWGPLRREVRPSAPMFPIVLEPDEPPPTPSLAAQRTSPTGVDTATTRVVEAGSAVGRVLLVALAVVVEVSVASPGDRVLSVRGAVAGVLYVVAIVIAAGIVRVATSRRGTARHATADAFQWDWRQSVASANALLAISALPLLLLVSNGTTVFVTSEHHLVRVAWLPVWLVVALTVLALAVWGRRMARARGGRDIVSLESNVLVWLVGPVLLYLSWARLPGALGHFYAFDDAQYLAAPQLIFHHGLLPWRNIYVLHGLLSDVFDGAVGMLAFGDNRWGVAAGMDLFVQPAILLSFYAFTAYFCRKNRLILVAFVAATAASFISTAAPRFVLLPVLFIVFDRVLRHRSWRWCWFFVFLLLAVAVLTPEELLFVPCFLGVVVLFELTTRRRGTGLLSSMPRVTYCAVASVVLTGAWLVYLAAAGSLSSFLQYFSDFAPGHTLEGAIPTTWHLLSSPRTTAAFFLPVVLWLLTVWRTAAKLRLRRAWSINDWLMVTAACISVIYFPKVLGRADPGHVFEANTVTLPLLLLWIFEALRLADRGFVAALRRAPGRRWSLGLRHVGTGLVTLVVLVSTLPTSRSIAESLWRAPANFHQSVPRPAPTGMPMLGYTLPGTVDQAQVRGLSALLDRYAGPRAPVYDFADEPGIVYYLLQREPGTRFYVSSIAQTSLAQQQVVSDLEASRPPVVIENVTAFGLPNYDGIPDSVRSYAVAHYLFTHYQPFVNYEGQLLMLRDDLVAGAPSLPPGMSGAGVAFSGPSCNFGDVPNFFTLPADLSVQPSVPLRTTGVIEANRLLGGWAVDPATGGPAGEVVAVVDGRVVATSVTGQPRPDVASALRDPAAADAGFELYVPSNVHGTVTLYGLGRDAKAYLLLPGAGLSGVAARVGPAGAVTVGHQVFVTTAVPHAGAVDASADQRAQILALQAPQGTRLAAYPWLQVQGSRSLGRTPFTVSNQTSPSSGHEIQFDTLPRSGRTVTVDVDSCLQWHGYDGAAPLYLVYPVGPRLAHLSVRLIGGPPPS